MLMNPQIVEPLGILSRIYLKQMLVQSAPSACPENAL
jgi:hypothetical protein